MDSEQNKPDDRILDPERAKAWIFTLALGVAVCLGMIVYTLITHSPVMSFDDSFFKPGLTWLGFIGWILFFVNYFLFWISTSILRSLPDNQRWVDITAILGVFSLLLAFVLLFVSYDLEHNWLHCTGYTLLLIGTSMNFIKELIQHKFNRVAKIWSLAATLVMFTGAIFMWYSLDAQDWKTN